MPIQNCISNHGHRLSSSSKNETILGVGCFCRTNLVELSAEYKSVEVCQDKLWAELIIL